MNANGTLRWSGVAGIELKTADQILLVDPYFTRIPFWRTWFGKVSANHSLVAELTPRCSYILVTHSHFDHCMDVPEILQNTGAVGLGSYNTCELLRIHGVEESRISKIRAGDQFKLGDFQVEVFRAKHVFIPGLTPGKLPANLVPPLTARQYRMDEVFSYRITVNGLRFLTDVGVAPKQGVPADILFVNPYLYRRHYETLLGNVRPSVVIPIHWDDFYQPLSKPLRPFIQPPRLKFPPVGRLDLQDFRRMIKKIDPGIRVFLPEALQRYPLDIFADSVR